MANNYSTLSALFTAIANAIRAKTGSTEKIVADNFPSAIAGISSSTAFTRYMHTITASGSFVVPATGKYRVTAIGKGADGYAYDDSTYQYNGGCGGGGYIEIDMVANDTYTASISSSAVFSKGSTELLRATGGSDSTAGTASSSVAGFVAFSSNGKSTSSIVPPDCYNNPVFISKGGEGGYYGKLDATSLSQGFAGGAGLFGGDGGTGGAACSLTSEGGFSEAGAAGGTGAGAGGAGVGDTYYAGASGSYQLPGGGGGGGYGGGGGKSTTHSYYYNYQHYEYGNGGKGGKACIFIERLS